MSETKEEPKITVIDESEELSEEAKRAEKSKKLRDPKDPKNYWRGVKNAGPNRWLEREKPIREEILISTDKSYKPTKDPLRQYKKVVVREGVNSIRINEKGEETNIHSFPPKGSEVKYHWTCRIRDNYSFVDSNINKKGRTIAHRFKMGDYGFILRPIIDCVGTMKKGERCVLDIPPELAYGDNFYEYNTGGDMVVIPPDSVLEYELELLDFYLHEEIDVKGRVWRGEKYEISRNGPQQPEEYDEVKVIIRSKDPQMDSEEPLHFILGTEPKIDGRIELAIQSMRLEEKSQFFIVCRPHNQKYADPKSLRIEYTIKLLEIKMGNLRLSNTSVSPVKDKIKHANILREIGNNFFKEGKVKRALRKYDHAEQALVNKLPKKEKKKKKKGGEEEKKKEKKEGEESKENESTENNPPAEDDDEYEEEEVEEEENKDKDKDDGQLVKDNKEQESPAPTPSSDSPATPPPPSTTTDNASTTPTPPPPHPFLKSPDDDDKEEHPSDMDDDVKNDALRQCKISIRLNQAICHFKLEEYRDCRRIAFEALKLNPNHPKLLFKHGQASMKLDEIDEADKSFTHLYNLMKENKDGTVLDKSITLAMVQTELSAVRLRQSELRKKEQGIYGGFLSDNKIELVTDDDIAKIRQRDAEDAEAARRAIEGDPDDDGPSPLGAAAIQRFNKMKHGGM